MIFVEEEAVNSHHFPFSFTLERDLTPDWILIICLAIIAVFAWINVIYTRFISLIFQAGINYQLSIRLYNDPGIVQKRISALFNGIYFISTGLWLYLLYNYFQLEWFDSKGIKIFLIMSGFLVSLTLFRTIIYKLTGNIFDRLKVFNEALFHTYLYNKLTGVVIVPFILLISYTRGIWLDMSVFISIALFAGITILRILRGGIFVHRNVISLFYFILYLCSLEILPLLVIIKLIRFLAKVS